MTESGKDKQHMLTRLPDSQNYDIGYGKPPKATRFEKGQSGNPAGRPRGSKNKPIPPALNEQRLRSIIMEEAYRLVNINDAYGQVSVPIAQAIVRSLAVNAAKGNQRAQRLFTDLLSAVEQDNNRLHNEWLETAINYKTDWERELERRRLYGTTGPEPLPHPDDVVIDMQSGTVIIKGPVTKEEKEATERFEFLLRRKSVLEQELADLERMLIDDPDCEHRALVEDDIQQTKRAIKAIDKMTR